MNEQPKTQNRMEVILMETDAYFKLLEDTKAHLNKSMSGSTYMDESEVMKLFHITNKSHFSQFRSKHQLPCYKPDRSYIYKRSEIDSFILKYRVNKNWGINKQVAVP